MKKLVLLLLPLLLCSCSDPEAARASRREAGLALLEAGPQLSLLVNQKETVSRYDLQCSLSESGEYVQTVLSPEPLTGLCATLSGKKLNLTYRDIYFAGETLGTTLPSPLYLYPFLHLALKEGSFRSSTLTSGGVRDDYLFYFDGDEYTLSYFYEGEKPVSASFWEDNTEYASVVLTSALSESSNE